MKIYNSHSRVPDKEQVDWIYIEFPDNRVFRVSSEVVAEDFANYYDGRSDDDVFEKEKQYALNNPMELWDWIGNNINWEDIEEEAEFVERNECDLSESFTNSEFSFGVEE